MAELDLEIPLRTGIPVTGDQEIISGFFDDAWKGVKSVIKSPATKVVVGGLAIAFPAVGVPAAAALATADIAVRATEAPNAKAALKLAATKGADYALTQTKDPEARKAIEAMRVIVNTKRAADAGDPDAVRGVRAIEIAHRARNVARKEGLPITHKTSLADLARKGASAASLAAASHRRGVSPGPGWIAAREGFYKRG